METVFLDANGWIALSNKRDQLNAKAVNRNKELLQNQTRYLTTNFVLDETYTTLMAKVGNFAAVDFGERVRNSKSVTIVHISPEIEEEAWQLFKKYSDKQFSFTDCTSFVVMQRFKLEKAFTNDHHFEQAGFSILL